MTITDRTRFVAAFFFVAAVASPSASLGGEPDRAESLFQRARALMEKNDFAAACPMLEEAYGLDHGEGTLLAMALCHESNGKPATALREYRESLALAVKAKRADRVMLAESHVQDLEKHVPRIVLRLPSPAPNALSVRLDAAPAPAEALTTGAAVDPGTHEVSAQAPDYLPFRTTLEIRVDSGVVTVDIPPRTPAQPLSPPPPPPPSSGTRVLGLVLGGVGLASAGVGTYFGIAAFNAEAKSKDNCTGNVCSSTGVSDNHDARTDALVADITLGAGAVAFATGLYFALKSPSRPRVGAARTPSLVVWAGDRRAGMGVATTW